MKNLLKSAIQIQNMVVNLANGDRCVITNSRQFSRQQIVYNRKDRETQTDADADADSPSLPTHKFRIFPPETHQTTKPSNSHFKPPETFNPLSLHIQAKIIALTQLKSSRNTIHESYSHRQLLILLIYRVIPEQIEGIFSNLVGKIKNLCGVPTAFFRHCALKI